MNNKLRASSGYWEALCPTFLKQYSSQSEKKCERKSKVHWRPMTYGQNYMPPTHHFITSRLFLHSLRSLRRMKEQERRQKRFIIVMRLSRSSERHAWLMQNKVSFP